MSDHALTALLVIDVQQALFERSTPIYHAAELLGHVNALIQRARDAGAPVVFIQHANKSFLVRDSAGWQLHPDLARAGDDLIVHKEHGSAFQDTALEILSSRAFFQLVGTGHLDHQRRFTVLPHHILQTGLDYLVEGGHDRHRVARQTEKYGIPDTAKRQWFSGLHGDFPEIDLAQLIQCLLDIIGIAHGNAARGDDHIGLM